MTEEGKQVVKDEADDPDDATNEDPEELLSSSTRAVLLVEWNENLTRCAPFLDVLPVLVVEDRLKIVCGSGIAARCS